jgi:hypothetical protein
MSPTYRTSIGSTRPSKPQADESTLYSPTPRGEFRSLGEITEEHFDKLFNTNVKGTLFTVQKDLPQLNDGASIILTGSVGSIETAAVQLLPHHWPHNRTINSYDDRLIIL